MRKEPVPDESRHVQMLCQPPDQDDIFFNEYPRSRCVRKPPDKGFKGDIRHQNENHQLLDREFQSFKYRRIWLFGPAIDWAVWAWWDYGSARERVFLCTIFLLLLFTLINFWLFERLNNEVYKLDNFKPDFRGTHFARAAIARFYYSFIYTAAVFFKVSVKFEKLKYTSPPLLAWFFFNYLVGFFCIFFIINAILKF
ncbi:hypothetical protein [Mucilaginibacter sp.]|uniref:hypothetical protein n=1 Tax=Mucilaginibacter sp. TaxID=1882438 RepID=UPI00374D26DA